MLDISRLELNGTIDVFTASNHDFLSETAGFAECEMVSASRLEKAVVMGDVGRFSRILNRHVARTGDLVPDLFTPSFLSTTFVLRPPAMTSRISIARPASGGYSPDPHGFGNSRPSAGYRAANPDDPIEKLRAFARTVEDNVDIYTQPLKPHLPGCGVSGRILFLIWTNWRGTRSEDP